MNPDNIHYLIHSAIFVVVLVIKFITDSKHNSSQSQIANGNKEIAKLKKKIKKLEKR